MHSPAAALIMGRQPWSQHPADTWHPPTPGFLQLIRLCHPGTAALWWQPLAFATAAGRDLLQGAASLTKSEATLLGRRGKNMPKYLPRALTTSLWMSSSSHKYCCNVTFSFSKKKKKKGMVSYVVPQSFAGNKKEAYQLSLPLYSKSSPIK